MLDLQGENIVHHSQKKKKIAVFFLGGGELFLEDPLGSSDHPSIIMGFLKVV